MLYGKLTPDAVEKLRRQLAIEENEARVVRAGIGERRRTVEWARAEQGRALAGLRAAESDQRVAEQTYREAERAAQAAGKQASAFLEADRSASYSLELLQKLLGQRPAQEQQDPELLKQLATAREALAASEAARKSAAGFARESLKQFARAKADLENSRRTLEKARLAVLTADADLRRAEAEYRLDKLRAEALEKGARALSARIERGEVEQTYSEVLKLCSKRIDAYAKLSDKAQNTETKVKTIFGGVTGGVAAVGSTLTGALSSSEAGGSSWYAKPSLWTGITTALLTTVGTIVTLTISPRYQQQVNRYSSKIRTIKERLSQIGWLLGHLPSTWSASDRARWSGTIAELKGLCAP